VAIAEDPEPLSWRELFDPRIDCLHWFSMLSSLHLFLVAQHRAAPLEFWGMEGYPPYPAQDLTGMMLVFIWVIYPLGFLVANWRASWYPKEWYIPKAARRKLVLQKRLALALGTLILLFGSWTSLLGMGQNANGFDWNRRWTVNPDDRW
jgi:hypothetical protein